MLKVASNFQGRLFGGVVLSLLLLALGGAFSVARADRTGKIAGRVTGEDGRGLASVNVTVRLFRQDKPLRGAATDLDGYYTVMMIPPGLHQVVVSAVGYREVVIEEVKVSSGITTHLDIVLEEAPVEMSPVTLVYKTPPIELKETSVRVNVSGETIRRMPVRVTGEIISAQAGFVSDGAGGLHLRGGRTGEIGYYIDGQRIEDPLYGEVAATMQREAMQELSVLAGTFSAEYGEAMSGIVQIITREGGDEYNLHAEYESPYLNSSPYRKPDWVRETSDAVRDSTTGESRYRPTEVLDTGENTIPGRLALNLSGPVPAVEGLNFFLNAVNEAENSHLPFGYHLRKNLNGKLTWSQDAGKLVISAGLGDEERKNYSHPWKYVPEHYHRHFIRNSRLSASWTGSFGSNLYYTLDVGRQQRDHDVKIFEEWNDYLQAGYRPEDFTFARYFYTGRDWSDTWRESRTSTWNAGIRFNWQTGRSHEWSAGLAGRTHRISLLDIRELQIGPDQRPAGVKDEYEEHPVETEIYLQDKIELDYLVVNAGLRLDYVDPRTQGWVDVENPESEFEDVDPSYQLSPRLGLAHPISDRLTLHFAYGHFFQYPDYVNLFLNSADLEPDTLSVRSFDAVGNRALKPQKTVAYEVGLKGLFTPDWGYHATAFYKDITDLVGTRQVRVGTKYNYAAFINIDYASVIGFELGLNRNLTDFWSLQANYTYSVARGNSSEPLEGFYNAYYERPEARQEYYLDFDRRHVANLLVTWQTSRDRYPVLLDITGLRSLLRGFSIGVIGRFAGGLPYTPYSGAGEQLALRNSERMDGVAQVDLRCARTFVYQPVELTAFINVDNIFDRTNPLRVNSRTGLPWETTLPGNEISFDQVHDPSMVDIPRLIRAGVSISY